MQELVGNTVREVWIDSETQQWLRFVCDEAIMDYQCVGDCCSETWIWSVVFSYTNFKPNLVVEVKELDLPVAVLSLVNKDGLARQDSDLVYAYRIVMKFGFIEIVFRNSSNGHYGGSLDLSTAGAPATVTWTKIDKDYTFGGD